MGAYQLGWIGLAGLSAVVMLTGCPAPDTYPADAKVGTGATGGGGTGGTGGTGGMPECFGDEDCAGTMVPACNKAACVSGVCQAQPDDSLLPADDGNVCTTDTCAGGVATYTNNSEICGNNPPITHCEDGICIGCTVDGDCPQKTECQEWTCMGKQCIPKNGPTSEFNDPVGNCTAWSCSGAGVLIKTQDLADIPADDANECTKEECLGLEMPSHTKQPGQACGEGPSCVDGEAKEQDTCDAMGDCLTGAKVACFPSICDVTACKGQCNDSMDCAGAAYCDAVEKTCFAKKALGQVCGSVEECQAGNFCPDDDKVCCSSGCPGPCRSCYAGVSAGLCGNLPKGVTDKCPAGQACGNSGNCADLDGAFAVGGPCSISSDCFNHVSGNPSECVNNLCRLHAGEVCDPAKPHECDTNLCDAVSHKCKECTDNMHCPSMTCDTANKRCLLAMGGTCGTDNDCQAGHPCMTGTCQ